jgi:hypothetical protein
VKWEVGISLMGNRIPSESELLKYLSLLLKKTSYCILRLSNQAVSPILFKILLQLHPRRDEDRLKTGTYQL